MKKSLGRRAGTFARHVAVVLLLCAVLVPPTILAADAPPLDSAAASTAAPKAQDGRRAAKKADGVMEAEALASEVLSRADVPESELGDWAVGVLEEALTRAGAQAETALAAVDADAGTDGMPLPSERGPGAIATGLPGRGNGATILVFMSLSVPAPSWRQWADEAARAEVPLLLRGPSPEGLRATIEEAGTRLGGVEAGVAIDPRLFLLFDITRVPAVIAVPDGVPPCASRGCADDAPPPFDRVTGNTGLAAALFLIAAEGEAGRDSAREHLEKLGVRL